MSLGSYSDESSWRFSGIFDSLHSLVFFLSVPLSWWSNRENPYCLNRKNPLQRGFFLKFSKLSSKGKFFWIFLKNCHLLFIRSFRSNLNSFFHVLYLGFIRGHSMVLRDDESLQFWSNSYMSLISSSLEYIKFTKLSNCCTFSIYWSKYHFSDFNFFDTNTGMSGCSSITVCTDWIDWKNFSIKAGVGIFRNFSCSLFLVNKNEITGSWKTRTTEKVRLCFLHFVIFSETLLWFQKVPSTIILYHSFIQKLYILSMTRLAFFWYSHALLPLYHSKRDL